MPSSESVNEVPQRATGDETGDATQEAQYWAEDAPAMHRARTIDASDNRAVLGGMRAKNNGRYNGNGRHWRTPDEVYLPLEAEFGFTLDPCATPESAKCARYFTEEQDGLAQDWSGDRVFMNPPYGREIYAWAKKAWEEQQRGALVVGLLPASTDLTWWGDYVWEHGADQPREGVTVRWLQGRVRFLTGGPYRASGFFASVIVIWNPVVLAPEVPAATCRVRIAMNTENGASSYLCGRPTPCTHHYTAMACCTDPRIFATDTGKRQCATCGTTEVPAAPLDGED